MRFCVLVALVSYRSRFKGVRSPEDTANWLSSLTFWWCNALIMLGYRRALEHTDLPAVSESDDAEKYLLSFLFSSLLMLAIQVVGPV